MIFGAVDVPAAQQIAGERRANKHLELPVLHAVLSLDGVGVLHVGGVGNQFEVNDVVPLIVF